MSETVSAEVQEVLDWVETEISCGRFLLPRTDDERAYNIACDRALQIVANYKNGYGLFQMTKK